MKYYQKMVKQKTILIPDGKLYNALLALSALLLLSYLWAFFYLGAKLRG